VSINSGMNWGVNMSQAKKQKKVSDVERWRKEVQLKAARAKKISDEAFLEFLSVVPGRLLFGLDKIHAKGMHCGGTEKCRSRWFAVCFVRGTFKSNRPRWNSDKGYMLLGEVRGGLSETHTVNEKAFQAAGLIRDSFEQTAREWFAAHKECSITEIELC